MGINLDKPHRWKADIAKSVDMYNEWFMTFAPRAFRTTRIQTTTDVEAALHATENLTRVQPSVIRQHPEILPALRMATCPPLASDRLIGLTGVPANLVKSIEIKKKIPPRMNSSDLNEGLSKITDIIKKMADPDIFNWLDTKKTPDETEVHRAATIVADRLCGAVANPIIRNAQEKRQLSAIKKWLEAKNYRLLPDDIAAHFEDMPPGTFSFRTNVPATLENSVKKVNIPVDIIIMPKEAGKNELPLFFEAKSAGDFANTNKRRKEEAMKISQLRSTYGKKVKFNLFLCGYFDSGYLGYEAAEGIDWVWEHRMDDFALFGI